MDTFYEELCKARAKRTPATLYHGTSSEHIPAILHNGLEDRKDKSVWNDFNTSHEAKNKRFNWNTRGTGPTFSGIYAASNPNKAREFAEAATGRHTKRGNHTYVEVQSHNRALHPDDDALAETFRQAHIHTPASTVREDLHDPANSSPQKRGALVRRSRKAFSEHALNTLGLHNLPEAKKAHLTGILHDIHDSAQRLLSLRDKTFIKKFRTIPDANDSLPFEGGSKLKAADVQKALYNEHEGHYRPLIKKFSDAVTWNKSHAIHNNLAFRVLAPHRILTDKIGYRGPTRITGIHEMEPERKGKRLTGHWIKTHYSEHKDANGKMIPTDDFIRGAHRANYKVLGLKDKDGNLITKF